MKTKKSGFTFGEMLVVMAIIAIIAAMLVPAYVKARDRARMIKGGAPEPRERFNFEHHRTPETRTDYYVITDTLTAKTYLAIPHYSIIELPASTNSLEK